MCFSDEKSDDGEVVIGYNDGVSDTEGFVWNVESGELLRRTKTFAVRGDLHGLLIIEGVELRFRSLEGPEHTQMVCFKAPQKISFAAYHQEAICVGCEGGQVCIISNPYSV